MKSTEVDRSDGGSFLSPAVDLISSATLAILASFALLWIIPNYIDESAANYDVSPAFIPKFAAWTVLGFSVIQMIVSLRRYRAAKAECDTNLPTPNRWHIIVEPLIWLLVMMGIHFGLTHVGFVVTGTLVLAASLYAAGQRSWPVIVVTSALLPFALDFAAWHIFVVDLP